MNLKNFLSGEAFSEKALGKRAINNRGVALLKLGRYKEAKTCFEKIVEIENSELARQRLEIVRGLIGMKENEI